MSRKKRNKKDDEINLKLTIVLTILLIVDKLVEIIIKILKSVGGFKITSHYSSILYMKNLKKAMLIFGIVIVLISIIIKFV